MVETKLFAAFIRAIGPESHKVMPQLKLCAACAAAGLLDVKSYIASGNLYFRSAESAAQSSAIVAKAITDFGIDRGVFVRSPAELDDVISGIGAAAGLTGLPSRNQTGADTPGIQYPVPVSNF